MKSKKSKKIEKFSQTTFKTSDVLLLVIITCIVSLFSGAFFLNKLIVNEQQANSNKLTEKVLDVYNDIKQNYYKDVADDELIEGAVNGMINALDDPYASYISEDNSNSFDAQLNGSYEGIGIEIFNNSEDDIEILTVFENSPADQAGLTSGDIIIELNGENVRKIKTSEVVSKISKLSKDKIKIKVLRENKEKEVTVQRKKVELVSVKSKVFDEEKGKIGYINISIFSLNTYTQFKEELDKLEAQNISSLVIDVRDNSGGYLSTADSILSLFLDSKHVIYQIESKGKKEKFYSDGKKTKDYPIVILTNEGSASASELLAISLKEEYKATIIGKKTYGKGTVQELKNFDDGEYKFTTKKWLSPKGKWINEKGVEPDIEIDLDQQFFANPTEENDNQLQSALDHLKNEMK